jgi:PEP-CTERM motif
MKNVTKMLVVLSMLVAGTAANAAVIFDNGITANNGFISDPDFVGTPKLSADDFRLIPGANVITDVHWTGLYAFSNTPLADNFTIQLFNDAGGVPATNPFLSLPVSPSRVDTGRNAAGSDIFAYDVNISPVTLAANTTFWLSIFNNTSNDPNDNWFWGIVDNAGNGAVRDGLGLAWSPFINGYEFQLTGVRVPEPSALALLALGVIALALLNRRRTPST